MATFSTTQVKILPGYRSETNVTVTDSGAGTFTASFRDYFGRSLGTVTVSVVDATTVEMAMTGTVTADICQPPNLQGREAEVKMGRWYLFLDDSDANGDSAVAYGDIIYQRAPADTFNEYGGRLI